MHIQLPKNLSRVQQVLVLVDPAERSSAPHIPNANSLIQRGERCEGGIYILLSIPRDEGQIKDEREPVTVDEEEEGKEAVDGGLGDDVGVEAVAKVDGVDVVTMVGWSGQPDALRDSELVLLRARGGESNLPIDASV